jgi:hypothetical protein
VSEQSDSREFDQLDRITAELSASLKSCRAIMRDCQQKLAANSNEADSLEDREDAGLL